MRGAWVGFSPESKSAASSFAKCSSEMFGVSFMVAALSFGNGLSGWPGSASFDGALIQLVLPPTTWGFLGNTGEFAIKVGFA